MTFLPREDMLWSMIVGTAWRDCVEGSVKIKRLLGLVPPTSPDFEVYIDHSPGDLSFPGFSVLQAGLYNGLGYRLDDNDDIQLPYQFENIIKVNAVFRPANLRLGSRCRQILIAYPVVKHATLRFREGRAEWPEAEEHIDVETGITTGDLIDAGCAMIDERIAYDDNNEIEPQKPEEWYDMLPLDLHFEFEMHDQDRDILMRQEALAQAIRRCKGKAYRRQKRIAAGEDDYDSDDKRRDQAYKIHKRIAAGEDHHKVEGNSEDSIDNTDGPEYREIQAVERAEEARRKLEFDAKEAKEAMDAAEARGRLNDQMTKTYERERGRYLKLMKDLGRTPPESSEDESSSEEEYTFEI